MQKFSYRVETYKVESDRTSANYLGRGSIERSRDTRHKSVTTADIAPLS
ncbi:MAG: hypothetical protein ACYTX0_32780 [Nostoc sp.]